VRVTSDRQTLILAGEAPPRRSGVDRLPSAVVARGSNDDADSLSSEESSQRVTFISARVDAVITQGLYSPKQKSPILNPDTVAANDLVASLSATQLPTIANSTSLPALPAKVHQAYVVSNRGSSAHVANAYARTRDLSDRTPLIDTYA
jgi:hypothetical protein